MQKFLIEGGKKLYGEIDVQGAKNSSLPILAGALLCDGTTTLLNCPKLSDVYASCRILNNVGLTCNFIDNNVLTISNSVNNPNCIVPNDLMREMRSSILYMGALLGKYGKCTISLPGGCQLGSRPIDIHLYGLKKLGADIKEEYGTIYCNAKDGLKGTKITLPFASVGATENLILASVLAKGETLIKNSAREPEICDLCNYLRKCGAVIQGDGESDIYIKGVKKLYGCEHSIIPDRVVAVTYMCCVAMTGGELVLNNVCTNHMDIVLNMFEELGCDLYTYEDRIYICSKGRVHSLKNVKTMPYPAFPTDMQSPLMAVMTIGDKTSTFEETIFDNRYRHADELIRMGADIEVMGRIAIVRGVSKLYGTSVSATDLRGGASLIVAGLKADGLTEISNIHYIDRGYQEVEKVLTSVGAYIKRV
ncbi:MAG: UDP-N-acetylglucosamine 1-carboxyvinyltransferase [Ruminococcus sp.]|nr:UDP-N-acetylglucosamine 1-carboxyvinyltransferase [Ruminococcus sp.]MCD7800078.1 UDP-N-acetylglucosamine 1-carboxyvinyltransferase [Ruminococcus sp.]